MVPPLEVDRAPLIAAKVRSVRDRVRFSRTHTAVENALRRATSDPDISRADKRMLRKFADERLVFIKGKEMVVKK